MKMKLLPDGNSAGLFVLATALIIVTMALYHREHNPLIVIYNPDSNLADFVQAGRTDTTIRNLMLGGLRDAVAMATGSHPYEQTGKEIKQSIVRQLFAPDAAEYVLQQRNRLAIGASELGFNTALKNIKIKKIGGSFYFEGLFSQIAQDVSSVRTFHVQAIGNLAPATVDNPYQIRFADFRILEINPTRIQR